MPTALTARAHDPETYGWRERHVRGSGEKKRRGSERRDRFKWTIEEQPQQALGTGDTELRHPVMSLGGGAQPRRDIGGRASRQHHGNKPPQRRFVICVHLLTDQPGLPLHPPPILRLGVALRTPLIRRRGDDDDEPRRPNLTQHPHRPILAPLSRRPIEHRVDPLGPQEQPELPHPLLMRRVVMRVGDEHAHRSPKPTNVSHITCQGPHPSLPPPPMSTTAASIFPSCDATPSAHRALWRQDRRCGLLP